MRNKHHLLSFLKDRESKGMGGVSISDIREAIPQADKVLLVSKGMNVIVTVVVVKCSASLKSCACFFF